MPSSFQKQAQLRKLTCGALILLLFMSTLLYRSYILAPWGDALDLREQKLGETELTSSVINLTLTGSRGLALVILWDAALKMQQRGEWSELDLTVSAITKLQPHYVGPWQFHSWNIAYNVPADLVRIEDKYFYIARGLELLAEGQRQNRDNPDLRFWMGTYYQGKFGTATDESNTLRTLLQLSCIKRVDAGQPNLDERDDRDPDRLRPGGKVHMPRFEKFCRQHPMLVRRLRESLGCRTPGDVINYLAARRDIPVYDPRNPAKCFPVLPPRTGSSIHLEYASEDTSLPDEFDNFTAARMWYTYAQEPLPPARPWSPPRDDDLSRYRMPKVLASILFRQYPARAQSYYAERLEKEGWFDEGWEIDAGKQGSDRWFGERKVVVGDKRNWAGDAWAKARELWDEHGDKNGLYLPAAELKAKEALARKYRESYGVTAEELDRQLRAEDLPEEMRASFEAHRQLYWYYRYRGPTVTNYAHFRAQAHALATPDGVAARKLFHHAHQKHLAGEDGQALRLYADAFAHWRRLFETQADFRADLMTQQETYQMQEGYLRLVRDEESGRFRCLKPLLVLEDYLAQGVRPAGAPLWLPPGQVLPARLLGAPVRGPCDAFISAEAAKRGKLRVEMEEKVGVSP